MSGKILLNFFSLGRDAANMQKEHFKYSSAFVDVAGILEFGRALSEL